MSRYIPGTDGYYYEISKNRNERSVCIKCANGQHYIVHPDRYIIGNDGYLYKIANAGENGVITVIGNDNRNYIVINKPMRIRLLKGFNELNDYKCAQPNPCPMVKLNGEGNVDCTEDTGICYINASKGTKASVGAPKGYKKIFDRNIVWLTKEE
jgi:ribosomal protein S27AE